jgi:hypothetical protein
VNNIAPINKGIQVLEKGTNFLSGVFLRWLQSVESRLNRAVVTDENGNIAYGGATIPDDVHPDYFHIFYPNNAVRVINQDGAIIDTYNAYVRNDSGTIRWQYIDTGIGMLNIQSDFIGRVQKFTAIDSGGPVASGVNMPLTLVHQTDTNGNVNIKTGSTYTATL